MKPTTLATIFVLTATLLAGCGKSPATATSSYSKLSKLASQPTPQPQPVAQGYDPNTTAATTTQTGTLMLGLSALNDTSGTVDTVDITLSGPGLDQPLEKKLTAQDMATSNTLDFDHIPASTLTASLHAMDKSGADLGTKTTTITVQPNAQTKVQLNLTAAPFSFTQTDGTTTSAGSTTAASGTTADSGTTPGTSEAVAPSTANGGSSDGALGVEIVNKQVSHKFLILKRLSVTVRVTNHNTTETLNGQVVVDFHKMSGIFSKTDKIVQTLTQSVTALPPGQTVELTFASTKSADDAQATVHTVLASATSDGN